MPSVEAYLAVELGISLCDGLVENAANREALDAVGAAAIARALERGAHDPEVGAACIELAVSALELSVECDLAEDDEKLLAWIGRHVRGEVGWGTTLVDAATPASLDALARLARAPIGVGIADGVVPRLLELLDGALAHDAMAVLAAIATREKAHPKAGEVGEDAAGADAAGADAAGADAVAELAAAVPRIIAGLADATARWYAAEALGFICDDRAIAPLIALLCDPAIAGADKAAAARALARLRAIDAAPALIAVVETAPPEHELADYVRALHQLDPVGAAPAVVRVARPDRINAHVVAIAEAGARAGDEASIAFLREAARGMPTLRGKIRRTLKQLGRDR